MESLAGQRHLVSNHRPVSTPWPLVTVISFALVFVPVVLCRSPRQSSRDDVPSYSSNAITIYHWNDRVKTARSPDGTKNVSIEILDDDAEDFPARVRVDTEQGQLSATVQFGLGTEVLWSPDSKAFAITGSCCGAGGQFETAVFYVLERKLVEVKLTGLVERAFGRPVKCAWPEPPNVVAVKWLIASKQLLVAAEIMGHTNCDSSGTFKAYAVNLDGPSVVKVLDQLEAKKQYHDDLGKYLLASDDVCILHPESCRVGSYHK